MCDRSNIANWERFEEAASSEKAWMHNRLNWLFTPQGILFTAYVLTLQKDKFENVEAIVSVLRWIIPIAGLITSIVVFIGVFAAGRMHWKWTSRLNELAEEINTNENHVIPFGSKPHWPARSSSILPSVLSIIFVLAWLKVIFV